MWKSGEYLANDVILSSAYCVVAVEAIGRQIPIAFLERIKEDFTKRYGGGKAATAVANSLNKEFGSKLKEHMQYCVDHPEEISKLAKVKAQVSEVKGVMMENIEKVLDCGEKIELLVDKTENLPTSFHLSIFNCFGNEEWQKKSKVSSENHSKNPARYLGGSRSIVQHLDEVHNIHSSSDSNTSGGYFEVFKKTHWSDSRGWTIERAKEDYDQMIKIRDACLSELLEGSELDSDVEEEIYSQVLLSAWYEKYGLKRGIGPVPRQASHGSKSGRPRYESLQNEVREGKLRMADMKYQLKEQRELIQNLLQRLNVPSNHPGPTLTSNEDPPPPPAPAAVC
ncbi:hypothetical protein TIFTF001_042564 [Ficus carica]|uniref:Longin domain-containing protein n=1 Tax=Ficus carica TaxID=3494 RepID=A0AA88A481_FICCA|nr:hypothetical protein TIFTF001_042564 [Ficus carica]